MEDSDSETLAAFNVVTVTFSGGVAQDVGTLGCCGGEGVLLGDQLSLPSPTRLLVVPF